jgi:hypothetical protein
VWCGDVSPRGAPVEISQAGVGQVWSRVNNAGILVWEYFFTKKGTS